MSRANEVLKEKFGISTEDKTLKQVVDEVFNKYDILDKDGQRELENLVFGRKLEGLKDYTLPASYIYTDFDDMRIKERLANDDKTRYTTEDIVRMREEKKLAREFKLNK